MESERKRVRRKEGGNGKERNYLFLSYPNPKYIFILQ